MKPDKIKIKYDDRVIEFEYSEAGKGYVGNKAVREMWYYIEDGALFVWSISGKWKRINKKEFEVVK